MLKEEFEKLAKIEVSGATYHNLIEPMYMAADVSKEEFVRMFNLKVFAKVFALPKTKCIKKMLVPDTKGNVLSPNRFWYRIEYVELADVDIRTGKNIVKALDDEELCRLANEGHDLMYSSSYDIDIFDCIGTNKKTLL